MSVQMWRPAREVIAETIAELHIRNEYPELSGLRTGIEALDKHASEAFLPGSLIVVAGESGRGKTAFLTQTAVAFSYQQPTLVFTLEDSAQSVLKRALANVSRQNVGRIRSGFAGEVGLPASVIEAADHIAELRLDYANGDTAYTVERIGAVVWSWVANLRKQNIDGGVVIIDQLSHIAPTTSHDAAWFEERGYAAPPSPRAPEPDRLEWQCFFLKLVAERCGVTMVLASQLNENHGDGEPGPSSIRGSRGIVHKANLVLIPWTPRQIPNPFAGPGEPKMIDNVEGYSIIKSVKSREVPEFREEIRWIGAEQRFVDKDKVDDAYKPQPALSPRALEGSKKLAELRASFERAALGTSSGVAAIGANRGAGAKQTDE